VEKHPATVASLEKNVLCYFTEMTDKMPPIDSREETLRNLNHRIDVLEFSLQQALDEKNALENQLDEIKASFAWITILKYRSLRERLLPLGTRHRRFYDRVKGVIRSLLSPEAPRPEITHGSMPELDSEAFNTPEAGSLDHPPANQTVRREPMQVWGWAVLTSPVARVDIKMDGAVQGAARLGLYRPELAKLFPGRLDAVVGGFEYLLDLTNVPDDCSTVILAADVYRLDGSYYPLSPVTIRMEPRQFLYNNSDWRAERRRAQPDRLESERCNIGQKQIRLLAFTHHLGYGGGQLYLYELLRQLRCHHDFTGTVVAPDDGPLRSAIENLGMAVHVTHGYPYQVVEMFERQVSELVAWARPQAFNVVLVNTVVALPGPEVAKRLGLPFLWAIHESYKPHVLWSLVHPPPGAHPQIRRNVTDALGKAAAVVFEAEATRILYYSYGDPERFVVVPYGIDIQQIDHYRASFDKGATRQRLGIPESATAILCMSTIEPRKAQISLIQAFREIAEAHPDAFLILVGDTGSPHGDAVRSYVAAAGLQRRVLISPVVPDPYEWYATADLLVCPSDVESLPRCVLEAMAFEVPVLATEVFGVPELITDGKNGYLCRPCDVAALTLALERVLSEPKEKRNWVAKNGAALVRTRHDSRGYADAYLKLMRGLIQNPSATPRELLAE
jgi:glycosyltransferase involved in cell wall biosynthesis